MYITSLTVYHVAPMKNSITRSSNALLTLAGREHADSIGSRFRRMESVQRYTI
jgi:hypothetical protein